MNSPKCPICKQYVERLLHDFAGKGEEAVVKKMEARHPSWSIFQGMCERCLYLNEFESADDHFLPDPGFINNGTPSGETAVRSTLFRKRVGNEFALLPTPLRLNADPRFRGKGITIAFIDSGFYPHPDLVKQRNRIKATVDVTNERRRRSYFNKPHTESWHGTMTSVAAAGDGWLSKGMYRGIASEADVVLIKVMDTKSGWINTENITRGIRWAIDHAEEFGIRIISLSVADDEPISSKDSPVDQAVEEAVSKGIVVVTAVGNNPSKPIIPPASSPSAITVGGLNDQNEIWKNFRTMFHSTYGTTVDGYSKPELIAPAIWVAGPILPGTDQFKEAPLLFKLLGFSPRMAETLLARNRKNIPSAPRELKRENIHKWLKKRIEEMKYIAPHYKHVDGTSFASPIVSSVVAQMLEANPDITPAVVKHILMETAEPLKNAPEVQQGRGVLNPRAAVERALRMRHASLQAGVHAIDGRLLFVYHNRVPRTVAVAGSFNNWNIQSLRLQESVDGWWSAWLPKPRPGKHQYKYVIDSAVWLEDPANKKKEPDGLGGWNSTFEVA
ncbi:serine protease [Sphingobacteriales bacterium CHB3]|nr:serine protease [Sphingobacteriales bacterium CHB3]